MSEPADLWTSRVSRKWGDSVPHIRNRGGKDIWHIGDQLILPVGMTAMAGFDGTLPECPDTMADIPPGAHLAPERLAYLDREGIHAQVLYPNVGGVCHRFPDLAFVSVESGVGWLLFVLEAFDWQWSNAGIHKEHPEYDLMPSDYFRRQIYGCFWFEEHGLEKALELYPDNILFETDYPHPTSMSVGPQSAAVHPREYASRALDGIPDDVVAKVLHGTAARLYGLS